MQCIEFIHDKCMLYITEQCISKQLQLHLGGPWSKEGLEEDLAAVLSQQQSLFQRAARDLELLFRTLGLR